MIGAPLLPYSVRKEIRALAPTWCACAGVIVAGALWRDPRVLTIVALAYGLGCIALGAQSIGHEYSHRTVGLLLSQPATRNRTLLVKFATLGLMVLALTVLAWPVVFIDTTWFRRSSGGDPRTVLVLAAMCALGIAPFLSMLCRTVLAAIVFTAAIPGPLFVAGDVVGAWLYGAEHAATIERFQHALFWRVMVSLCAFAIVACWWMFSRLEAIEGRGPEFHLPSWLAGAASADAPERYPSATSQLVAKELRIQQVTIPVVVLYVVGYLTLVRFARNTPAVAAAIDGLSMLYSALIAMLIGALASAEERHMGTLEWQTLQPIPLHRQWAIKVSVVLSLGVIFGAVLPYALRLAVPAPGDPVAREVPMEALNATMVIAVMTSISLYVSSLSSSGVRALVLAFPVIVGAGMAIDMLARVFGWVLGPESVRWAAQTTQISFDRSSFGWWIAVGVVFVAMALWFASVNHRSVDRPIRRIVVQASCMLGYASVFMTMMLA
jgi:ABC-type transport system involved in multi-copper enzyme maturation permease subunit